METTVVMLPQFHLIFGHSLPLLGILNQKIKLFLQLYIVTAVTVYAFFLQTANRNEIFSSVVGKKGLMVTYCP